MEDVAEIVTVIIIQSTNGVKMSKPETMKIDDVEYIRKDSVISVSGDIKIVVADRGFVYVGNCVEAHDFVTLTNAKNIRKWGTTKGLGELVKGPLSNTVLDPVGSVKIPMRAVISIISVDSSKWTAR